jgi:hypothetical protein
VCLPIDVTLKCIPNNLLHRLNIPSITLFSGKYSEIASSFNLKNKQTYCERFFLEINFYGLDKLTAIKYSAVTGFIIV